MINYVELVLKVPEGYEGQVKEVAVKKIESILSVIMLKPTQEMEDNHKAEVEKANDENGIKKEGGTKVPK